MNVVNNPIFFIGFPRSGTTIIFEAFSQHEKLGWPSNYSGKFPKFPWINWFRNIQDNKMFNLTGAKRQGQKASKWKSYLIRPAEAYPFWDNYTGVDFSFDYLIEKRAGKNDKKKLDRAIQLLLKLQNREKFSAKFTGPPRITYLNSLFPNARFIHIIRDPRAVINSCLSVSFWKEKGGFDGPFWKNGFPTAYHDAWIKDGNVPSFLAALQWKFIMDLSRDEAAKIPDTNYIEIKYEKYIENPHQTIESLYGFCGLDNSERVHSYIDNTQKLKNMNYKYFEQLEKKELGDINSLLSSYLMEFGYQV